MGLRRWCARSAIPRHGGRGEFNNEIKHAERAFSRLLAGGALATFRKPTKAGGFCMGFVYAGAYGSELDDEV